MPRMKLPLSRFSIVCLFVLGSFSAGLSWKTLRDLRPLTASLDVGDSEIRKPCVVDRYGNFLSVTHQNRWNTFNKPLHDFPDLLHTSFIESEDRRFYIHGGVDWFARLHALVQNIRAMRAVRGASTISEQVVRMLHPRPRTVWSRWLEGFEAANLEKQFSKSEILEFYLNQVPYGHQRRGVAEAAKFYFDRDLDTLSPREILALVVLVRAPSSLDLRRAPKALERSIARLAAHLRDRGTLSSDEYNAALSGRFEFARSNRVIEATHFVQNIFKTVPPEILGQSGTLTSTLDGDIQEKVSHILDSRLENLRGSDVRNGAVLVADNSTGEVLAWASGSLSGADSSGWMDAVIIPRQPGSSLKPFLYALAIEMGWGPATLIDDSPLAQPVRSGLHSFHNYSRTHYGPLRLREALGNSLNTPAVRTIQFTGTGRFLEWLHLLGIRSLTQSADFYGQGLALGDGEVSLFELVQAYSVLARRGEFRKLRVLSEAYEPPGEPRTVMDQKSAALITDILSDPQSRRLEFGEGHLLRFPVQTAVKTGTSTDHKDCWAVGYTDRLTVGVWMGNLDRRPTRGITGAIGPALVLRSVFAELNRYADSPVPQSAGGLKKLEVCAVSGLLPKSDCPRITEVFNDQNAPADVCAGHGAYLKAAVLNKPGDGNGDAVRLLQPVDGLQVVIDPRIPLQSQALAFKLPKAAAASKVEWILDGEMAGRTSGRKFLWSLSRGTHFVKARFWRGADEQPAETPEVSFTVK